ncbi:MAG: hypothetical protein IIZ39_07530 [Blautia sp.]|nr:hypothetical protein [Blautia sp.]
MDEEMSLEVDWGYTKMTLSVSWETEEKHLSFTRLSEFDNESARRYLLAAMPLKERNWKEESWGANMAEKAIMAGPIRYMRIKGSWEDIEVVTLEIWPICDRSTGKDEYITELSFKEEKH